MVVSLNYPDEQLGVAKTKAGRILGAIFSGGISEVVRANRLERDKEQAETAQADAESKTKVLQELIVTETPQNSAMSPVVVAGAVGLGAVMIYVIKNKKKKTQGRK